MRVLLFGVICACLAAACSGGTKASPTPTPPSAGTATATPVPPPTIASDGNAPGIPPLTGPIQLAPSGLHYIDETVGAGPTPRADQTVTAHTTIWLADGHRIDSTRDRNQPLTFALSSPALAGLGEGVSTMRVGGKRRLIVPPALAYGSRPIGGAPGGVIPANSTLIVDVELLSVK